MCFILFLFFASGLLGEPVVVLCLSRFLAALSSLITLASVFACVHDLSLAAIDHPAVSRGAQPKTDIGLEDEETEKCRSEPTRCKRRSEEEQLNLPTPNNAHHAEY